MRISRDQWAMNLAVETSKRGTCLRRQVGCVLLNVRGHVLSTGYNGVASGIPHCNEPAPLPIGYFRNREIGVGDSIAHEYLNACSGAKSPSGTDLDSCHAIHAEQNALLQCRNVHEIDAAYITLSPCITCAKLLLNTSCKTIFYLEQYTNIDGINLWKASGRNATCLTSS